MMTMLTMEAGKIVHDSEWGQFTSATLDKDEEAGGLAPALGALPTPHRHSPCAAAMGEYSVAGFAGTRSHTRTRP